MSEQKTDCLKKSGANVIIQRIKPHILWGANIVVMSDDDDDLLEFVRLVLIEAFVSTNATFFSVSDEFTPLPFKSKSVAKVNAGEHKYFFFSKHYAKNITKRDIDVYLESVLSFSFTNGTGIFECLPSEVDEKIDALIDGVIWGNESDIFDDTTKSFCFSQDIDAFRFSASSDEVDRIFERLKSGKFPCKVEFESSAKVPAIFDQEFWERRQELILKAD